jgi:mobilization protein MobC
MTGKTDFIRFRIQADLKAALFALAEKRRLDVSKLIIGEITRLIREDEEGAPTPPSSPINAPSETQHALTGQLCFRPLPGDELYVKQYAEGRQLAPGILLKLVLRGWINKHAPMPRDELLALGVTSNQLAAIGRNLNQFAKLAHSGRWPDSQELRVLIEDTAQLTQQVSEEIDAVVRANLNSWENEDA